MSSVAGSSSSPNGLLHFYEPQMSSWPDPGAPGFARLPTAAQDAVVRAGEGIGERVGFHTACVLIGNRQADPPEDANHASAVMLLLEHRRILATAWHVVA